MMNSVMSGASAAPKFATAAIPKESVITRTRPSRVCSGPHMNWNAE